VGAIANDLLNGYTLSQAFGRHPDSFDPLFIGMIRIGEAGGLLDEVLKRLAELAAWEMELRAQMNQALQYPLIVLATLSVALALMVTVVLPRFAQMFSSMHQQLPLQTRAILALSRVLVHDGWLLALLAVLGAIAGWRVLQTPGGRRWWDAHLLRLPVVGPLCVQLDMSRVTRTVAVLNASGLPMLDTLTLAAGSVKNTHIQGGLASVLEQVRGGQKLATAMKAAGLFPPVVVQMVATGEETGRMDELLSSVSDYYDQQAAYLLRKLITYVEPALLLIVGLGVLAMASAVLVPMWDMVNIFKAGR